MMFKIQLLYAMVAGLVMLNLVVIVMLVRIKKKLG